MSDNRVVLCVKHSKLPVSHKVQKDIDLKYLLEECCMYFNTEEEALEQGYVPLCFMTTVRSAYTNQVLERREGKTKKYYNCCRVNTKLPHTGLDLSMYMNSRNVLSCIGAYTEKVDSIMIKSKFQHIGLINIDPSVFNPTIYSQVILHDSTVEDFKSLLLDYYDIVPIQEMQTLGHLKPVIDSIILVKEEREDEQRQCDSSN